jgi:ABC-type glycerol-3-phosphate transport system permease component
MERLLFIIALSVAVCFGCGLVARHRRQTSLAAGMVWSSGLMFLWIYLLLVMIPLVWVLVTSLKPTREILDAPFSAPRLLTNPSRESWHAFTENFRSAWEISRFKDYFFNSVKVSTLAVAGTLLISAMGAYPLARFRFKGASVLLMFFLAGMMIPAQLTIVPLFFQSALLSDWLTAIVQPLMAGVHLGQWRVNLFDSHLALALIYVASNLPFGVFVLTNYMRTIPNDLREAALMDGASEWCVFWRIMLPMARPGMATLAIFTFLSVWNEYMVALVFLNMPSKRTLPLGLANMSIQSQYTNDIGVMFAGMVIALAPMLLFYVFAQRSLTKGLTLGALKA